MCTMEFLIFSIIRLPFKHNRHLRTTMQFGIDARSIWQEISRIRDDYQSWFIIIFAMICGRISNGNKIPCNSHLDLNFWTMITSCESVESTYRNRTQSKTTFLLVIVVVVSSPKNFCSRRTVLQMKLIKLERENDSISESCLTFIEI